MKICTSWGWGSWLLLMLLGAGGATSCGPATQNTETGAAANTDTVAAASAARQSAAAPVARRPNPSKPGKPGDKVKVREFVQNFKQRSNSKDLRSAFFDTTLLKSMLQDCQCAGLRFYLADSLKPGGGNPGGGNPGGGNPNDNDRKPHMIVVRVDAAGKDMDLDTDPNAPAVPGKRRGQFKMGFSDERCPDNCGGCTLDQ